MNINFKKIYSISVCLKNTDFSRLAAQLAPRIDIDIEKEYSLSLISFFQHSQSDIFIKIYFIF